MTVQGQAQAHQGSHDAKRQRTTHSANAGYNQVWVQARFLLTYLATAECTLHDCSSGLKVHPLCYLPDVV